LRGSRDSTDGQRTEVSEEVQDLYFDFHSDPGTNPRI
jgi:hypothetical protein